MRPSSSRELAGRVGGRRSSWGAILAAALTSSCCHTTSDADLLDVIQAQADAFGRGSEAPVCATYQNSGPADTCAKYIARLRADAPYFVGGRVTVKSRKMSDVDVATLVADVHGPSGHGEITFYLRRFPWREGWRVEGASVRACTSDADCEVFADGCGATCPCAARPRGRGPSCASARPCAGEACTAARATCTEGGQCVALPAAVAGPSASGH